ncbi:MAG: prolipoprotein diacylglyceryl transferase, partial [Prevotella sp.]|nr:prolipoprotein diacylglyceryl transferase [Prevotella sp.]
AYFCFIFIMLGVYLKSNRNMGEKGKKQEIASSTTPSVGTGFYFGLVLTLIFTFRFFIEYTKDIQVDFENGMFFNMGQLLSIPFIIIGIVCMKGGKWMNFLGAVKDHR